MVGIGSLFNHSENPNVTYTVSKPAKPNSTAAKAPGYDPQGQITFRSAEAISVGQELCIDYGLSLWFQDNHEVECV